MRYEIQKQEKRDTTKLVLTMPPPRPDRTCVQLDIEIQLPYSADYLSINVQNVDLSVFPFVKDVDEVILNNSNGNVFIERWTGETLNVRNENGLIKVGQLSAGESIHIRNSNGPLQLQSDIYSKHDLDIINTNGEIGGVGRLGADDRISVETSNGVISLDELNSDNIYVTSSNGDILLRRVAADARAILRTSEGLIDASIIGSKNNVVVAQTSVGDVSLHVTHEFEGHFSFSSSNGRVDVPRDEGIDYDVKTDSDKKGNRLKGKGDMSVSTSSGDVQVVFDL
ncbi:hypothetical protein K501DRAFT_298613 [Backusella circina FSU 941]|nr:hypothetical protein K501DRAFT_298613 [Backusella circina FSU 941]